MSAASGAEDRAGAVRLITISRAVFEEIKAEREGDLENSAFKASDLYRSGYSYEYGSPAASDDSGGDAPRRTHGTSSHNLNAEGNDSSRVSAAAFVELNRRVELIESGGKSERAALMQKIDDLGECMRSLEKTTSTTQAMLQDLIRHSVMSVRLAKTPDRQRRNPPAMSNGSSYSSNAASGTVQGLDTPRVNSMRIKTNGSVGP